MIFLRVPFAPSTLSTRCRNSVLVLSIVESCRLRPTDLDHISIPFLTGIVVILHRHSLLVLSSCLIVPARRSELMAKVGRLLVENFPFEMPAMKGVRLQICKSQVMSGLLDRCSPVRSRSMISHVCMS